MKNTTANIVAITSIVIAGGIAATGFNIYKNYREFQKKLEPTAVYSTITTTDFIRYRDTDRNGKLESVLTDPKTDIEYKLERLPSGELKISRVKNQ